MRKHRTPALKLIECPRDAWQALPRPIPAEVKADYLRLLIAAGLKHIDAVSFVSAAAVPQMADSEQVLKYLDAAVPDMPEDVEIIAIVVNEKGAERAIATAAVQTLGFPYSISPEFLKRNQNQTPEECLDVLEAIGQLAFKAGLDIVAYVSMAFGNPYGDAYDTEEVIAACDLLVDMGITQISLADTVGLATPRQIEDLSTDVLAVHDDIEIGLHLHAHPNDVALKVAAAYRAGIRRMDMAVGGLGGCPFAQDALVGNLATELAIAELKRLGAELPALAPLDGIIAANQAIADKFGAAIQ
ncbi:Hydroxymethylglutaryl-CoA lyase [Acidisarcina polymorpha]|uniref:Hydroxymethylglutaryl-CoA lyase n=1 Tax=Acidisarcina polymorpha TaxID=2211140 RepID=A0A2Z5FTK7_9BACT|nr:hydroxymethylglutaryl-CoA lyase [Acidisarcina polymorpha]AXC09824.1 Hydroxymethylglutaryl-CoA lyase [Acidisarcina polymorpha]